MLTVTHPGQVAITNAGAFCSERRCTQSGSPPRGRGGAGVSELSAAGAGAAGAGVSARGVGALKENEALMASFIFVQ